MSGVMRITPALSSFLLAFCSLCQSSEEEGLLQSMAVLLSLSEGEGECSGENPTDVCLKNE